MTQALTVTSMRSRLAAEGHSFDFYQAVRLLRLMGYRNIRFRSRVSLGFPASDVYEIRFLEDGRPEVTVNFMGLAGLLGPLPIPLTELILATPGRTRIEGGDVRRKTSAVVDFLDIFNHRLISLMYRVRQTHRPALTSTAPSDGPAAKCLFALIGLGNPALRSRMKVDDPALLFYAGILSARPRSAVGLQRILADYFGVPVKIRQFMGRWRDLDPRQWTIIGGPKKQNFRLGRSVVLGTRVWDEQTHIRIRLGPMPRQKYMALLPGALAHDRLRDLVRFYLDPEMTFSIVLKLEKQGVFSPKFESGELRLGLTSWLAPVDAVRQDQTIRLEEED
jgi:type VI secretion system protein ImpH